MKNYTGKIPFYLLAALLALIPFHAFLVTFLNALFFDTATSAPLFLRMWKEVVIVLLGLFLVWKLLVKRRKLSFIKLDYFVLAYLLLGFFSAIFITQDLKVSIFGAKYDFEFLILYLIIRQFSFSKAQLEVLVKIIVGCAGIVILFGLLQKFVLPENFLANFGYSPEHSHFSPNKPLAYCQKISGTETCRVQSFLSGPNQLGSYLLVILPLLSMLALQGFFKTKKNSLFKRIVLKVKNLLNVASKKDHKPFQMLSLFFCGFLILVFSYSRAAWLGFSAMFLVAIILLVKNKKILWYSLAGLFLSGLLTLFALIFIAPDYFHEVVFRPSSTQGHSERMADGIKFSLENPLGLGLGNAGPASNHFAENYLGFVPESWYLQVSLELGILGILIYLTILVVALKTLYQKYKTEDFYALALLLSLVGIMVASFFLHSWEDSATALIFWGLAGAFLQKNK